MGGGLVPQGGGIGEKGILLQLEKTRNSTATYYDKTAILEKLLSSAKKQGLENAEKSILGELEATRARHAVFECGEEGTRFLTASREAALGKKELYIITFGIPAEEVVAALHEKACGLSDEEKLGLLGRLYGKTGESGYSEERQKILGRKYPPIRLLETPALGKADITLKVPEAPPTIQPKKAGTEEELLKAGLDGIVKSGKLPIDKIAAIIQLSATFRKSKENGGLIEDAIKGQISHIYSQYAAIYGAYAGTRPFLPIKDMPGGPYLPEEKNAIVRNCYLDLIGISKMLLDSGMALQAMDANEKAQDIGKSFSITAAGVMKEKLLEYARPIWENLRMASIQEGIAFGNAPHGLKKEEMPAGLFLRLNNINRELGGKSEEEQIALLADLRGKVESARFIAGLEAAEAYAKGKPPPNGLPYNEAARSLYIYSSMAGREFSQSGNKAIRQVGRALASKAEDFISGRCGMGDLFETYGKANGEVEQENRMSGEYSAAFVLASLFGIQNPGAYAASWKFLKENAQTGMFAGALGLSVAAPPLGSLAFAAMGGRTLSEGMKTGDTAMILSGIAMMVPLGSTLALGTGLGKAAFGKAAIAALGISSTAYINYDMAKNIYETVQRANRTYWSGMDRRAVIESSIIAAIPLMHAGKYREGMKIAWKKAGKMQKEISKKYRMGNAFASTLLPIPVMTEKKPLLFITLDYLKYLEKLPKEAREDAISKAAGRGRLVLPSDVAEKASHMLNQDGFGGIGALLGKKEFGIERLQAGLNRAHGELSQKYRTEMLGAPAIGKTAGRLTPHFEERWRPAGLDALAETHKGAFDAASPEAAWLEGARRLEGLFITVSDGKREYAARVVNSGLEGGRRMLYVALMDGRTGSVEVARKGERPSSEYSLAAYPFAHEAVKSMNRSQLALGNIGQAEMDITVVENCGGEGSSYRNHVESHVHGRSPFENIGSARAEEYKNERAAWSALALEKLGRGWKKGAVDEGTIQELRKEAGGDFSSPKAVQEGARKLKELAYAEELSLALRDAMDGKAKAFYTYADNMSPPRHLIYILRKANGLKSAGEDVYVVSSFFINHQAMAEGKSPAKLEFSTQFLAPESGYFGKNAFTDLLPVRVRLSSDGRAKISATPSERGYRNLRDALAVPASTAAQPETAGAAPLYGLEIVPAPKASRVFVGTPLPQFRLPLEGQAEIIRKQPGTRVGAGVAEGAGREAPGADMAAESAEAEYALSGTHTGLNSRNQLEFLPEAEKGIISKWGEEGRAFLQEARTTLNRLDNPEQELNPSNFSIATYANESSGMAVSDAVAKLALQDIGAARDFVRRLETLRRDGDGAPSPAHFLDLASNTLQYMRDESGNYIPFRQRVDVLANAMLRPGGIDGIIMNAKAGHGNYLAKSGLPQDAIAADWNAQENYLRHLFAGAALEYGTMKRLRIASAWQEGPPAEAEQRAPKTPWKRNAGVYALKDEYLGGNENDGIIFGLVKAHPGAGVLDIIRLWESNRQVFPKSTEVRSIYNSFGRLAKNGFVGKGERREYAGGEMEKTAARLSQEMRIVAIAQKEFEGGGRLRQIYDAIRASGGMPRDEIYRMLAELDAAGGKKPMKRRSFETMFSSLITGGYVIEKGGRYSEQNYAAGKNFIEDGIALEKTGKPEITEAGGGREGKRGKSSDKTVEIRSSGRRRNSRLKYYRWKSMEITGIAEKDSPLNHMFRTNLRFDFEAYVERVRGERTAFEMENLLKMYGTVAEGKLPLMADANMRGKNAIRYTVALNELVAEGAVVIARQAGAPRQLSFDEAVQKVVDMTGTGQAAGAHAEQIGVGMRQSPEAAAAGKDALGLAKSQAPGVAAEDKPVQQLFEEIAGKIAGSPEYADAMRGTLLENRMFVEASILGLVAPRKAADMALAEGMHYEAFAIRTLAKDGHELLGVFDLAQANQSRNMEPRREDGIKAGKRKKLGEKDEKRRNRTDAREARRILRDFERGGGLVTTRAEQLLDPAKQGIFARVAEANRERAAGNRKRLRGPEQAFETAVDSRQGRMEDLGFANIVTAAFRLGQMAGMEAGGAKLNALLSKLGEGREIRGGNNLHQIWEAERFGKNTRRPDYEKNTIALEEIAEVRKELNLAGLPEESAVFSALLAMSGGELQNSIRAIRTALGADGDALVGQVIETAKSQYRHAEVIEYHIKEGDIASARAAEADLAEKIGQLRKSGKFAGREKRRLGVPGNFDLYGHLLKEQEKAHGAIEKEGRKMEVGAGIEIVKAGGNAALGRGEGRGRTGIGGGRRGPEGLPHGAKPASGENWQAAYQEAEGKLAKLFVDGKIHPLLQMELGGMKTKYDALARMNEMLDAHEKQMEAQPGEYRYVFENGKWALEREYGTAGLLEMQRNIEAIGEMGFKAKIENGNYEITTQNGKLIGILPENLAGQLIEKLGAQNGIARSFELLDILVAEGENGIGLFDANGSAISARQAHELPRLVERYEARYPALMTERYEIEPFDEINRSYSGWAKQNSGKNIHAFLGEMERTGLPHQILSQIKPITDGLEKLGYELDMPAPQVRLGGINPVFELRVKGADGRKTEVIIKMGREFGGDLEKSMPSYSFDIEEFATSLRKEAVGGTYSAHSFDGFVIVEKINGVTLQNLQYGAGSGGLRFEDIRYGGKCRSRFIQTLAETMADSKCTRHGDIHADNYMVKGDGSVVRIDNEGLGIDEKVSISRFEAMLRPGLSLKAGEYMQFKDAFIRQTEKWQRFYANIESAKIYNGPLFKKYWPRLEGYAGGIAGKSAGEILEEFAGK